MDALVVYYWLAFAVTFWLCLKVPTKMSAADNFYASAVLALFGFVVWPLVALAAYRSFKRG
jgi:hypothetical protein